MKCYQTILYDMFRYSTTSYENLFSCQDIFEDHSNFFPSIDLSVAKDREGYL